MDLEKKIVSIIENNSPQLAAEEILELFSIGEMKLHKAKVGDYLKCERVYSQSKKYTVGCSYKVIDKRSDHWEGDAIAVRDDNDKLTWIPIRGLSFTDFMIISA